MPRVLQSMIADEIVSCLVLIGCINGPLDAVQSRADVTYEIRFKYEEGGKRQ